MRENNTKNLCHSDIGYYGTPIDALTKDELLDAFLELAQTVVNCASINNQRKTMLTVKKDQLVA